MKSLKTKKIAAAIAVVNLFLEQEKEIVAETGKKSEEKAVFIPSGQEMLKEINAASTVWAVAGRMESMNIRTLWSLKLYK